MRIASACIPSIASGVLSCSSPAGSAPAILIARGPISDSSPFSKRPLVQLDVVADLEATDHVEQALQRRPLGVEQQLDLAGGGGGHGEDPQVAQHLALVCQKGRVAAFAGRKRCQLVGDLAVEELHGIRPAQRELPALGAIEQAAVAHERLVVVLERVRGSACH